MSFFHAINNAASGLTAQRFRIDVISDNIANATTTRTSTGDAFRRSRVLLRPREDHQPIYRTHFKPWALKPGIGDGVKVVSIEKDQSALRLVYDPSHPDALKTGPKKGYVQMPNVVVVKEMVDMISASRSYEANVSVVNSAKGMFQAALNIGNA